MRVKEKYRVVVLLREHLVVPLQLPTPPPSPSPHPPPPPPTTPPPPSFPSLLDARTHLYDSQIYLQCDNNHDAINAAITRLQNCILKVIKWMTSNALKIDEEKTECIIFNSTNIPSTSYTLQIGDNIIPMNGQVNDNDNDNDNVFILHNHI